MTASPFLTAVHTSTAACFDARGNVPPRRDQGGLGNLIVGREGDNQRRGSCEDGGSGRDGTRMGRHQYDHSCRGDLLSPSYIADSTMKRAQEHIRDFSAVVNINNDSDGISPALSQWYVTAAEIIMLVSKVGGRGSK